MSPKLRSYKEATSGFALIAVLAGAVILIIAFVAFQNTVSQALKTLKLVEGSGKVEDVRQLLRIRVDCDRTFADGPATCTTGTAIALKANSGAVVVTAATASPYTSINDIELRATCTSVPKVYFVEKLMAPAPGWNPLFTVPFSCVK